MLERKKEEKRESREEEQKENITILWSAMYILIFLNQPLLWDSLDLVWLSSENILKKKNFTVELLSFQRKWINLYQKFIVTDNNKQPMLPINKVSLFKNKMIS